MTTTATTTATKPKSRSDDSDKHAGNVFIRHVPGRQIENSINSDDTSNHYERLKEEPVCLPYFQSIIFATVLEDSLAQVRILAECNNQLRYIKTMADIAILRAKKYQIKTVENKDDLSKINTKDLGNIQYKLDKLFADRTYFQDVLEETYLELCLHRCFNVLINCNKEIEEQYEYRFNLAEEEAKKQNFPLIKCDPLNFLFDFNSCRRELLKQLRQQRIHIKSVAYDLDLVIDQLRSKIEDAALNSEIRGRYITNWQRARTEQHDQTIDDKESSPSNAINYYRNRSNQEQRVHSEIELLFNIFISETLTKVENWMNKYDKDMEAIDLQITIMKNKYQDEVSRRKGMEEDLARHEDQMEQWKQFKSDREKALQYRKKMTESAIIVQAWWRGLLVRLELGPFKPKKKPRGLPDDKKGKKKK